MLSLDSASVSAYRGPCPSFFRACCYEASRAKASGVRVGYDHPGYHLALHVMGLQPNEVDRDDWMTAINALEEHLNGEDEPQIINWFCRWFPRCMALVPRRRYPIFLKGIYRGAIDAGFLNWDELPSGELVS